jgi:membrane associated rhomboid family serine protease
LELSSVFFRALRWAAPAVLVMLAQWAWQLDLAWLGIAPRRFLGLPGIALGPFIHADWGHLLSNLVPFVLLFTSVRFFYPRVARPVLWVLYLGPGLGVWLLARPALHVGASGVVYACAGFLFFSGVFRNSLPSLIISVVVALLYGSMVAGIFPGQPGNVSWESHLLGGLVGAGAAFAVRRQTEPGEQPPSPTPVDGPPEGYRNLAGKNFRYVYRENRAGRASK